jgi:type II secretory pathway pseudopilin PulG
MSASRTRLAQEHGWSLVELLVAMTMMIVVLGATLTLWNSFEANARVASIRADTQDRLRTALDRLARDLRNVAGTNPAQSPLDRATTYDLIFLSVDPNGPSGGLNSTSTRRLRYCLNNSNPANEQVWVQVQTWTSASPPSVPSSNSCPDSGWGNQTLYADSITNEVNGQSRPMFSFTTGVSGVITNIHADMWANVNQGTGPPSETHMSTGVFLRNQDQPPVGSFTAQPQAHYGVILNGSASYDPEGQPLSYSWYDGTTKVGAGITFTYTASSGGNHTLSLKVFDPASLEGDAPAQTVSLYQ